MNHPQAGTLIRSDERRGCYVFRLGIAFLLVGGGLLALIPIVYGSPRPVIQVAFRDMDDTERARFERTFGLSEPVSIGPRAWAYIPLNTNREVLAALVTHPSVVATDGIDRRTARISRYVQLTGRRNGLVAASSGVSRATKGLAYLFLVVGAAASLGAVLLRTGWPAVTERSRATLPGVLSAASQFLQRGVPVASANAAGLFRIAFGSLVLWVVLTSPLDVRAIAPASLESAAGPYGLFVRWAIQHPWSLEAVEKALVVFGGLWVAGVRTSVSFGGFVIAFVCWASVFTVEISLHTISALSMTLVCLLAAPWGDGLSVDAWWRRRSGMSTPQSSRRYGYAFWIPCFVFGVTFAAAAWAKIGGSAEWILNGTVKYHFLTDLDHAWVQWGPQLTRSHPVAVFMSGSAVLVEALTLTAAFARSTRYRLAMGGGVAALLTGFALFQGVFWRGWWLLLAGFLPWHRISKVKASDTAAPSLTRVQITLVVLIVAQQICMSTLSTDARPLFSTYDMYATTYRPEDDYDTPSPIAYRVVAETGDGWVSLPGCVLDQQEAIRVGSTLGDVRIARSALPTSLAECLAKWPNVTRVRLDGDRQIYDWSAGRLVWKRRVDVIGPIRTDGGPYKE